MSEEMQVTLPEGVLKPIIQAQVISALQGQEKLVAELVSFVLTQKVRDAPSYRDAPFLEVVSRRLLREAIEDAVKQWIAESAPAIKREVERQMRGKVRGIASRLVAAVSDSAAQQWKLKIAVDLGGQE